MLPQATSCPPILSLLLGKSVCFYLQVSIFETILFTILEKKGNIKVAGYSNALARGIWADSICKGKVCAEERA